MQAVQIKIRLLGAERRCRASIKQKQRAEFGRDAGRLLHVPDRAGIRSYIAEERFVSDIIL